jgi:aryl-alcohol dehydrogenase-like predicted oxidoreductase
MIKKPFINNTKVSRLGFGGWQLGSNETWGKVSEQESIDLVNEAVKQGINFFDTAPGYSSGRSEKILGIAFHDIRDQVFINSKIGHKEDGNSDFSIEGIEASIKGSLGRLQTTYLDSALLHNPSMEILQGKTKHFIELKRLKEEGLIHAYGVSIDSYNELKTVMENTDIQVVELLFNIFAQSPIPLFNEVKSRGTLIISEIPLRRSRLPLVRTLSISILPDSK